MRRFMLLAALCAALVLALAPTVMAQQDVDCGYFATQEEAQQFLLPGDPNGLDADNDGTACDNLPSGGTGGTTPQPTAPTQYATPTAPTPSGDLDCADFASQAEAQATFDADPTDPNGLDADGDGIACEETFSAPPTVAAPPTEQYEQPVTQTVTASQPTTQTTTALPATGGLPLVPLAGASLLGLGVAVLMLKKRVS